MKFFLDCDSFYAEATLYVAAFPHLKEWLSERATKALAGILEPPESITEAGGHGVPDAAQSMQAAGPRFLPQVLLLLLLLLRFAVV